MSKRSHRFTALIGWVDRPTVDGRVWRGTVRLRDAFIVLRAMPEVVLCSPPRPDGYDTPSFLGRIHTLHIGSGRSVWVGGRATPEVAEALNDGTLMLCADLDGATRIESREDGTIFTDVVIVGATVGRPHQFPWKERP